MARSKKPLPLSLALAMAVSAGACSFDESVDTFQPYDAVAERNYDFDLLTPERPDAEELSGLYAVTSKMDLTGSGILPETVAESISALSNLRENPTRTMVDMLVAADVPLAQTVLDLIPDAIEDQVFEMMDDYVLDSVFQQVPGADYLTMAANDLASMITDFEMVTTMNIAPIDEYGNTKLSHKFAGIAFTYAGKRMVVYAPALLGEASGATGVDANAVHLTEDSPRVEDARLYVGDHAMSVPVGKLAMMGLDVAAQKTLHAPTFRDGLGQLFDCRGMAKSVAETCPGSFCAAVEEPIAQMCEAGLDEVVNTLSDNLSDIQIDLVRFTGGEAAMYDLRYASDRHDGKIDRIERGHWDVSLAVRTDGEHLIVPGSFAGLRIGDYVSPQPPTPGYDIAGSSNNAIWDSRTGPTDTIDAPMFDAVLEGSSGSGVGGHEALDDPADLQVLPGGYEAVDPARADAEMTAPNNDTIDFEATTSEPYGLDTIVTDALGTPRPGGTVVEYTPNGYPQPGPGVGGTVVEYAPNGYPQRGSGVGGTVVVEVEPAIIVVIHDYSQFADIFGGGRR